MSVQREELPDSAFRFLSAAQLSAEPELPPAAGALQDAWRRLRKNKVAVFSALVLLVLILLAALAPVLAPYPSNEQHMQYRNLPPRLPGVSVNGLNGYRLFRGSWTDAYASANVPEDVHFLFGTDEFGRIRHLRQKRKTKQEQESCTSRKATVRRKPYFFCVKENGE